MTALLSRTPEVACRLIALDLLARVRAAAGRLEDPDDGEALHDFRVALRRLRSISRAYRGPLAGSLRKRDRRRLGELARATGPGREAEVAAAWVEGQHEALEGNGEAGVDWLLHRFERRQGRGYEEVRERVREELRPLADELEERLGIYTREIRLTGTEVGPRFGELVGAEVGREAARLEDLLRRIGDAEDSDAVHQARLSVKRLRYLLEPLRREMAAVRPILARLRELQDLMGDLHDAYLLDRELTAAVEAAARDAARARLRRELAEESAPWAAAEAAAAEPTAADPVPGLLALARLNRLRRDRLFGELAAGWLVVDGGDVRGLASAPRLGELAAAVRDLVRWLDSGFSPPPPESAEAVPALVS